jgi:enoyl-CoA hydratase
MTEVIVRLNDGVGELVLNRPAQRNALTGPLVQELTQGLQSLQNNLACSAVVVRGAEGYFCAGLDLKAFSAEPAPEWRAGFQDLWAQYHQTVLQAEIPVIGALQGFAIAGGSSLALSCDFLVAAESAFMHVSEVERNMLAPLNVFWLTQRYGYQVALRMGLLGQRWTAPELLAAGLVEQCVPDEQVVDAARDMAARFASFDQQNVRALKRSIQAGAGLGNHSADFAKMLEAIKTAAAA